EPAAHEELLLEMVAQREVEEGGLEGGQLHGGGEPALDDGEIGRRMVLEELGHEGTDVDLRVLGQLARIEARPGHEDHARLGNLAGDEREGLRAFLEQPASHPRAAHGTEDHAPTVTIAELPLELRAMA